MRTFCSGRRGPAASPGPRMPCTACAWGACPAPTLCLMLALAQGASKLRKGLHAAQQKRTGSARSAAVDVAQLHLQVHVRLVQLVLGAHAQRHAQDLARGVQPQLPHLQLCRQQPHLHTHQPGRSCSSSRPLGQLAMSTGGARGVQSQLPHLQLRRQQPRLHTNQAG